jgi:hypothetical protein
MHNLRERNQIKALINGIRNSSQGDEQPTIPKIVAVFLAESLQVIMNPQHILYEKVNTFLLQRTALDLKDIPMFYSLSNTGNYFEREVDWLLDIMIAGLHDEMVVISRLY